MRTATRSAQPRRGRRPSATSPLLQLVLPLAAKGALVSEASRVGTTPARYVAAVVQELDPEERERLFLAARMRGEA